MRALRLVLLCSLLVLLAPWSAAAQEPASTAISEQMGALYVVQSGDWLSTIAAELLGDGSAYMRIVEATNARAASTGDVDAIADPNQISVGQRLWVPGIDQIAPSGARNPLWQQLEQASFKTEFLPEPITLVDGQASVEAAPGSASKVEVSLINAVYTDLDGDGVEDAAAVLATSGGGSGTFYTLEAYLSDQGVLGQAATQLLGDRIRLQGLYAEQGRVTVSMVVAGPDDPLCCPATPSTMTFELADGAWSVVQ